jgi:hypothetical protein
MTSLKMAELWFLQIWTSRLLFWGPLLWSSGQSSWLQIQKSGFDSRSYQIFGEVVGLERGPFCLLSTTEELLGRNSSRSGLENRKYGRGDRLSWPRDTLYPQKFALTSPISGGRSVSIVRLRTKATEFVLFVFWEVRQCSLQHMHRRFRVICCCVYLRNVGFHLKKLNDITSQKIIFINVIFMNMPSLFK